MKFTRKMIWPALAIAVSLQTLCLHPTFAIDGEDTIISQKANKEKLLKNLLEQTKKYSGMKIEEIRSDLASQVENSREVLRNAGKLSTPHEQILSSIEKSLDQLDKDSFLDYQNRVLREAVSAEPINTLFLFTHILYLNTSAKDFKETPGSMLTAYGVAALADIATFVPMVLITTYSYSSSMIQKQ